MSHYQVAENVASTLKQQHFTAEDKENCRPQNEMEPSPRNDLKMRDFGKLVSKNVNMRWFNLNLFNLKN